MTQVIMIKTILMVVGAILLIFFLHLTGKTVMHLRKAVQTEGRVNRMAMSKHREGQYTPVVEFYLPSGERVFFSPPSSSSESSYDNGQEVTVIYDPDFPEDAKIKSFFELWLAPLVQLVAAGLLLFVGFAIPVAQVPFVDSRGASPVDENLLTFGDKLMFFLLHWFLPGSFMIIGFICIVAGLWNMKKMISSYYWPKAKGIVLSSEVISSGEFYYPEIKYVFQVNGKKYESSNFDLSGLESGDPLPSKKAVKRYPKGKKAAVYYNPENPEECVLEPGMGWSLLLFLAGGAAFLFVGWILMVALRKGWIK